MMEFSVIAKGFRLTETSETPIRVIMEITKCDPGDCEMVNLFVKSSRTSYHQLWTDEEYQRIVEDYTMAGIHAQIPLNFISFSKAQEIFGVEVLEMILALNEKWNTLKREIDFKFPQDLQWI